jgi:hypothetical protein
MIRLASLIALCGVVLSGTSARADFLSKPPRYASPQNWALEISIGWYTPDVDNEFGGKATPYQDMFGGGALMTRIELDYQIWRGFGSIGIGLSVGFSLNSVEACKDTTGTSASDFTSAPSSCSERTSGTTSFNVFPISLLAVYRFDWLAKKFGIPIVPFGKIGLNYTIWWASGSSGDAVGGSWGWQANGGGAIMLDPLEPSAAKVLDNDLGINHSYIFFEVVYVRANSFGKANAMQVGDTSWQAGLAFEF